MTALRNLGLQARELVLLAIILMVAIGFAVTVKGYSSRFESALEEESQAKHHQISELVTTLASLERTIRTSQGKPTQERMQTIHAALEETQQLVTSRTQQHLFSSDGTYSSALSKTTPLIADLQIWLNDGFAGLPSSDPLTLSTASHQIYLTKLQLQRSASKANAGTLRLLRQQSGQVKNFARTVNLLILTMCCLFIWAWWLQAKNKRAQAKLWHQRKLTHDSINNINEGFVLTNNDGDVQVVNETLPRLSPELGAALKTHPYKVALGHCVAEGSLKVTSGMLGGEVTGTDTNPANDLQATESETSESAPGTGLAEESSSAENSQAGEVLELLTNTGRSLRVTNRATTDGGRVITLTDITDLKETQDKLHQQANYDYLTGIANRSYYVARLNEALAAAKRHGHKVALLQFDLDKFKQVNDTLGHDFGDQLLITTAERIKRNLREFDLAARIGGDEFAAILDHVRDENEVITTADRVISELRQELEIDGIKVDFSASIGIALYPDHANDIESLIKHADIACYRAKDSGRNNYKMYGADMKVEALQLRTLENKLRKAIDRDELSLTFQPLMHLENRSIRQVEVFSRWYDAKLGHVPPHQFIPVAEKNGLIAKLGEQILQKAFHQLHEWKMSQLDDITVAVNMTKRHLFMPTLPETIDRLSSRYEVGADRLAIEITEDVISDDVAAAAPVLESLSERGIKIIIDDYGMGTSSLPSINQLPIDALKIDGEFIRKVTDDESTRDIVAAIISSATSLKIETIAENVETEEQVKILEEMGCTAIQGYFVGQPTPADQLTPELLERLGADPDLRKAG